MILVGPEVRMTCCTIKDKSSYPTLAIFDYKYSKLSMIMCWQVIQDSQRLTSWCAEISTGQIFKNLC